MSSPLDQYMFVSNAAGEKSSNIQSYVQSRLHKVQCEQQEGSRTSKHRAAPAPSKKTELSNPATPGCAQAAESQCPAPTGVPMPHQIDEELRKLRDLVMRNSAGSPYTVPSLTAPDPFSSTSLQLPPFAWRYLKWPLSTFITHIFRAESLDFRAASLFEKDFRHERAVQKRIQLAVHDQLHMASTLLYSASVLVNWKDSEVGERSVQLFSLWTIQTLRDRLASLDKDAGPEEMGWLILAIHSLTLSAIWNRDFEAASCHMKVNRTFVRNVGYTSLDPYVREAILVGDKYMSIIQGQPPLIIPSQWEDECPVSSQELALVDALDAKQLGQSLRQYLNNQGHCKLLVILEDILLCLQVAAFSKTLSNIPSNVGSWMFMRHLTLIQRLLTHVPNNSMEDCCRMAMMMFLAIIGTELGAKTRGRFQKSLDRTTRFDMSLPLISNDLLGVRILLWASVTLALGAQRWDWDNTDKYLDFVRKLANDCHFTLDETALETHLTSCLYLPKVQSAALVRLIDALRPTEV